MITIDEYHIERFTIPFEQVRENLRKIFDEYGVTQHSQDGWLECGDFYSVLLDNNGELSKHGKEIMERWKGRFGDYYKEMVFDMYIID